MIKPITEDNIDYWCEQHPERTREEIEKHLQTQYEEALRMQEFYRVNKPLRDENRNLIRDANGKVQYVPMTPEEQENLAIWLEEQAQLRPDNEIHLMDPLQ